MSLPSRKEILARQSEEDAMDDAQDADILARRIRTPAAKLEGEAKKLFSRIAALLPTSVNSRHGSKKPLEFKIDLFQLKDGPQRDDVMARTIEMFTDIGFTNPRHIHNVGVNTMDLLEMTAPVDWIERVLKPKR